MNALRERVESWLERGTRVAIARVVETTGSAPCAPGTLMAISESGDVSGSIGVDCVEGAIVSLAARVFSEGGALEAAFDASGDELTGIVLPCGGAIRVRVAEVEPSTFEALSEAEPPVTVVLAGSNDYARALADLCKSAGYEAILVDPRPAFATNGVRHVWPDEFIETFSIASSTAIVLLSHDTRYDCALLLHALRSPAFYVGAIGSRRTQQRRRERLLSAGASASEYARLHAPAGIDTGGRSPIEVAISIAAEIIAVRNGKAGGMLKDSQGPIHRPHLDTATLPV